MREDRQKFTGQDGVTAVELIVVFVIIAIVAAMAVMSGGSPNKQFQRQNVARELKVAFERARFDSVKRHAEGGGQATVVVSSDSYSLTTDVNQNGTFETAETVVTNFATQNISISGHSSTALPVTVIFNKRGEATAQNSSGAVSPIFLVCNGTCSQSPSPSDANIVLVTPTGTVNLLPGNAAIPSFANANVTSVATTTGISNTVSLP